MVSFVLQNNYLVFMAELFLWFEVIKPSFVKPRVKDIQVTGKSYILSPLDTVHNCCRSVVVVISATNKIVCKKQSNDSDYLFVLHHLRDPHFSQEYARHPHL